MSDLGQKVWYTKRQSMIGRWGSTDEACGLHHQAVCGIAASCFTLAIDLDDLQVVYTGGYRNTAPNFLTQSCTTPTQAAGIRCKPITIASDTVSVFAIPGHGIAQSSAPPDPNAASAAAASLCAAIGHSDHFPLVMPRGDCRPPLPPAAHSPAPCVYWYPLPCIHPHTPQLVARQKGLLFLVRQHDMQRHQLVLRDVDQQLRLLEILNNQPRPQRVQPLRKVGRVVAE